MAHFRQLPHLQRFGGMSVDIFQNMIKRQTDIRVFFTLNNAVFFNSSCNFNQQNCRGRVVVYPKICD